MNTEVQEYLKSLTPKEKKASEIAKDQLKSLFDIENTNGFLQWSQQRKETKPK